VAHPVLDAHRIGPVNREGPEGVSQVVEGEASQTGRSLGAPVPLAQLLRVLMVAGLVRKDEVAVGGEMFPFREPVEDPSHGAPR
jgi:hypothetical protein